MDNAVDRMIVKNSRLSRNVGIYLSHRHTGEKLDVLGRHFGVGGSAVCKTASRFAQRIKDDKKLGKATELHVRILRFP
jgi:hypothetical protein